MKRHFRPVAVAVFALVLGGCPEEPPKPTSIGVSHEALNFAAFASQQVNASVLDQHGDSMPGQEITWSSNNNVVATVSSTGLVAAHANGTATVTVTGAGIIKTIPVTVAQAAAVATKAAGDAQNGVGGQAEVLPLVVHVVDAAGVPVANAGVAFAVTAGGGSIAPTATTDFNGDAAAYWTLGAAGTTQTVSATVGALAPLAFTATSITAASARFVSTLTATDQNALVGYATNAKPGIRVVDNSAVGVPGLTVTFAVTAGGGSIVGPTTVVTDVDGLARLQGWVVGGTPGTNRLSATVTGTNLIGNPRTFTAQGLAPTFTIQLQNFGPPLSPTAQAAFDAAVAMWERVIYVGVGQVNSFTSSAGSCGTGSPAIGPIAVPNVRILMAVEPIDGAGAVLGQAGPCAIRGDGHTILGVMRFDVADVDGLAASGNLNAVILHEMGHVLGFNSFHWGTYYGCIQLPTSSGVTQDTYFSCPSANVAFANIGGNNYTGGNRVPLENCVGIPGCGAGNYNSHWRELTFENELMTGYLDPGAPLSILTIAAMEDEGYTVNYAAAEAYTRVFSIGAAGAGAGGRASAPRIDLGDDFLRIPVRVLDRSGRLLRVIQP